MYVYNYKHISRAACTVRNPPANNYDVHHQVPTKVKLMYRLIQVKEGNVMAELW